VTTQCARCHKFIRGEAGDPVISAKSLGWKNYHEACAKLEWQSLGKSPKTFSKKVKASDPSKPSMKKSAFRVDCTMWVQGEVSTMWCFDADSLEAAEAICEKQMRRDPGSTGVAVNVTRAKYVTCRIVLLLASGGETVVDEKTPTDLLKVSP